MMRMLAIAVEYPGEYLISTPYIIRREEMYAEYSGYTDW